MTTLDINQKLDLSYCIPLHLRDEQIRHAIRRAGVGRIAPGELRDDPLAIVCYGPSLRDTWQEAAKFPTVMSMSGSHRFLVERGRIPNLHVEVDPRPHKVALIGDPQVGTTYYVSSCCHPAVHDHLQGQDVRLWHVFTGKEVGFRPIPFGEWALSGGSGVGIRAVVLARLLGYTNIHIFGMDGSASPKYGTHAGDHPNQTVILKDVEYSGRTFRTTASMLEVARETWPQLNQLPDITVEFHGEGLVQEMAKTYTRAEVPENHTVVAVHKPPLMTPDYLAMQRQMHRENPAYGTAAHNYAQLVGDIIEKMQPKTVLDWACGKGCLGRQLGRPIWEFDLAIPGKDESAAPAEFVACIDTLEHVEEECLPAVLDDLRRVTQKVVYFSIALTPALKSLPDGRNTHILLRDEAWWKAKLGTFFHLGDSRVDTTSADGREITHMQVVCGPKAGAPPPGAQTVYAVRSGYSPAFGILQYDPDDRPGRAQKPKPVETPVETPAEVAT